MSETNPYRRDLDGKVAIVTGGTQGLGEAIAHEFVARGLAGIVVTGRNRERGDTVAAALSKQGCRAVFHAADRSPISPRANPG